MAMIKGHYTKAEHLGDVEVPGAHGISFRDPDTLYISRAIGHTEPTTGGVTTCTMDLRLENFFSNSCSYYAVAAGPDGEVVVRNGVGNEIEIYSQEKIKVFNWELPTGKQKGMAVTQSGQIYVCDAQSDSIRVYESSGELVRVIKDKDVKSPQYVAITDFGIVVTCVGDEPAVVCLNMDAEVLWVYDDVEWPTGIAADSNSDVYVCDTEEKRIVMVTKDGELSFDMINSQMLKNMKPFAVAVSGDKLAVQLLESDTVKLFRLTS